MARESDALAAAMAATEQEMFASALGGEPPVQDDSGDRSLEQQGDGLEGRIEDTEEDTTEVEAAADDAEGEPEAEGDAEPKRDATGKFVKAEEPAEPERAGRVPAARLRETAERARAAEAERDAFKSQIEEIRRENKAQLDLVLRQMEMRNAQPQQQAAKVEAKPDLPPDIFIDPDGYRAWVEKQVEARAAAAEERAYGRVGELEKRMIGQNLAMGREAHGEKFDAAYQALLQEANTTAEGKIVAQKVWRSDNPTGELMRWHRDRETLREVNGDPATYRQKIADETRAALLADPEFRKEMLAAIKTQASAPTPNGAVRHVTRLPKSLNNAAGSSQLNDHTFDDQSDSAFFERSLSSHGS